MKDINFADALYILLVLSLVVQFLTDRIKAILPDWKVKLFHLIVESHGTRLRFQLHRRPRHHEPAGIRRRCRNT